MMKTFLVILYFIFSTASNFLYATDSIEVSDRLKISFQQKYSGAESVKWEEGDHHKMVSFVLMGHRMQAYYSANGEWLGAARDLLFDQLPMPVIASFDNHFKSADFIETHEISNNTESYYWITIEMDHQRYHADIDPAGNLLKLSKIK